jgi:hypothetical protein
VWIPPLLPESRNPLSLNKSECHSERESKQSFRTPKLNFQSMSEFRFNLLRLKMFDFQSQCSLVTV